MVVIRLRELREKSGEELQAELEKVEKEIRAENSSVKTTGKPKNAGKYREMRKVKARIKTLLSAKGIRI